LVNVSLWIEGSSDRLFAYDLCVFFLYLVDCIYCGGHGVCGLYTLHAFFFFFSVIRIYTGANFTGSTFFALSGLFTCAIWTLRILETQKIFLLGAPVGADLAAGTPHRHIGTGLWPLHVTLAQDEHRQVPWYACRRGDPRGVFVDTCVLYVSAAVCSAIHGRSWNRTRTDFLFANHTQQSHNALPPICICQTRLFFVPMPNTLFLSHESACSVFQELQFDANNTVDLI
jgi:hypothetical protein